MYSGRIEALGRDEMMLRCACEFYCEWPTCVLLLIIIDNRYYLIINLMLDNRPQYTMHHTILRHTKVGLQYTERMPLNNKALKV